MGCCRVAGKYFCLRTKNTAEVLIMNAKYQGTGKFLACSSISRADSQLPFFFNPAYRWKKKWKAVISLLQGKSKQNTIVCLSNLLLDDMFFVFSTRSTTQQQSKLRWALRQRSSQKAQQFDVIMSKTIIVFTAACLLLAELRQPSSNFMKQEYMCENGHCDITDVAPIWDRRTRITESVTWRHLGPSLA